MLNNSFDVPSETRDAVLSPIDRATTGEALFITGVLVAAFTACYATVIVVLAQQWLAIDTYSFGILVPLISAYLIWLRRASLRLLPIVPSYAAGGVVVASAAVLLLLGRLSAIVACQEVSLVLMIPGLVLSILGWKFLRALWFPLAYLLLMLPVWDVITDPMHYPFQLLSARIGLNLLRSIGIPASLDQVYLTLPNITLEVAKACSGVNYLISVVAMGVPLAYVSLKGWAPRMGLVAFAIVIAFVSNGLRVALIGSFSYYGIADNLHGPGHVLTGVFVSMAGFAALFAGVGVLARRYPRRPDTLPLTDSNAVPRWHTGIRSKVRIAAICAAVLLVTTAAIHPELGAMTSTAQVEPVLAMGGGWHLLPDRYPARFVARVENVYSRAYLAPTGERIELLVTAFAISDPHEGVVYRSVEPPREPGTMTIQVGERSVRVKQVAFRDSGQETHVVFWYDLGGHVTANQAVAKAYTALQLLARRWPPARVVIAASEGPPGNTGQADVLNRFVRDLLLALR